MRLGITLLGLIHLPPYLILSTDAEKASDAGEAGSWPTYVALDLGAVHVPYCSGQGDRLPIPSVLHLEWHERGVSDFTPPVHTGLGTFASEDPS